MPLKQQRCHNCALAVNISPRASALLNTSPGSPYISGQYTYNFGALPEVILCIQSTDAIFSLACAHSSGLVGSTTCLQYGVQKGYQVRFGGARISRSGAKSFDFLLSSAPTPMSSNANQLRADLNVSDRKRPRAGQGKSRGSSGIQGLICTAPSIERRQTPRLD